MKKKQKCANISKERVAQIFESGHTSPASKVGTQQSVIERLTKYAIAAAFKRGCRGKVIVSNVFEVMNAYPLIVMVE